MKKQAHSVSIFLVRIVASVVIALLLLPLASAQELTLEQVLNPDRVIEVSIEIPKEDWSKLCQQNRDPGKVFQGIIEDPFTYFKGDIVIDGVTTAGVGIRKKGFIGSLDNQFPSLKINFSEFGAKSPIDGIDSLTLNNNKQDSSLVSQFLSYQLFNAAGVHAPRCSFVRLTVNKKYLGIYSNVETIAKPYLRRRFGNDEGNLYEGTLADFYPQAIDRLEIKTNRKNHDAKKITKLAKLLATQDAIAIEEIDRIVDIDNFLKYWTMESLLSFWDGYTNNQNNFWVYDNVAKGKLYFMPWGADMAFMQPPFFVPIGQSQSASVYAQSMLANRLIHDESIARKYRETMKWQLANTWKEKELIETIDRLEVLLKPHLHQRQSAAPNAMKNVRQFIQGRRDLIENELEAWPVKTPPEPRKPMYYVDIGSIKGTLKTKFAERPPQKLAEIGEVKMDIELRGKKIALKKAGASIHKPARGGFLGFGAPPPEPPSTLHLSFSGIREPSGREITLTIPIDSSIMVDRLGTAFEIRGTFASGEASGGFMPMAGSSVEGSLTLTKAGKNPGDDVEGQFDVKIVEVHGGFFDRRPPEPPRASSSAPTP